MCSVCCCAPTLRCVVVVEGNECERTKKTFVDLFRIRNYLGVDSIHSIGVSSLSVKISHHIIIENRSSESQLVGRKKSSSKRLDFIHQFYLIVDGDKSEFFRTARILDKRLNFPKVGNFPARGEVELT